jgi:hypothetical protein
MEPDGACGAANALGTSRALAERLLAAAALPTAAAASSRWAAAARGPHSS